MALSTKCLQNMKSLSELQQDTEDWHKRRRISIGSSDASVILRIDPYRTYQDLLDDKLGKPKKFEMNEAMRLGKKWESGAREMFNFSFDRDVQPMVGVHDLHNFLLASFDGLCKEHEVFVEIKYVGHKKVENLQKTKTLPPHHYAQVQHQFLVSGYKKAYYIPYALSDNKKAITKITFIEVDRDEDYLKNLLSKELEFWELVKSSAVLEPS